MGNKCYSPTSDRDKLIAVDSVRLILVALRHDELAISRVADCERAAVFEADTAVPFSTAVVEIWRSLLCRRRPNLLR